ncbi:LOW QUALITY PROTEIN: trafficking protein particle complex II-specific subunit 120 [Populus alba x Populus x berolinensis]|nr:LOW QUALITY PROTEIN: trafficking protein particle complex II-specific subunit 120 [Populus alba x Populus x berolinensis]
MEPDVSIETFSMIRIAILPIGQIPHQTLRDYYSMFLHQHTIPLSSISSFYTEEQKSPFANQPWDTVRSGSNSFSAVRRLVLGKISSQIVRSWLLLVFVIVRYRPILIQLSKSLMEFVKVTLLRVLLAVSVFFPCDSQLEDGGKKGDNLRLSTNAGDAFTDNDARDSSFIVDGIEKYVFQAESSGTILKTPLDSQASLSSEEVIKAKKRRLGRAQKTIGDYCLLAGSPVDANAHYSTALDLARLTTDYFWYAGALEAKNNPALEDEVRDRYDSVILHYKKSFIQENAQRVSPLSFELEANLKLARFLCRRELAKEVVELLTSAADGAKSLIDATDRLILYVAQLYLQQDNKLAAISALQVLALTTKAYCVQSRASISDNSHINEVGSSHADSGKMHHQRSSCCLECCCPLLRSYYPLITPVGQNGLARALANSSERLPSGTRSSCILFLYIPLKWTLLNAIQQEKDWWAGSAPSGPFIYTPFSKGELNDSSKKELIWIVGEPVQILVELANPCGFNLKVDSIYLSVHSGNLDPFPISVDLPPNSSKVIALSGIPTSVGLVTIPGCIVHCFGVITEHLFRDVDNLLHGAAEGLVLSDPFRSCGSPRLKNVPVPNISVVPPLPLLVSHFVGVMVPYFYMKVRYVTSILVWLMQALFQLNRHMKNQDSVISIPYETLNSVLPLKLVILPVTLKAWKLGLVDLDNASGSMGRQLKDSSSPSLLIHYAGPLTDCEDPPKGSAVPPGRRLVVPLNICVLQGFARLLSMEIPAHVGENLPKPVYVENSAIGGLRFLELELSNPTDVVFEITVSVQLDSTDDELSVGQDATVYGYPKTRIDRDFSARVLIPLEHFKLPILDGSFFMKDFKPDEAAAAEIQAFQKRVPRLN